ncbi:DUF1990 domain-containing protein [Microvirga sp. STS02]|uniref:DUF1990 domain-containing protein n=1 Tax=Hymenobacter negativus TaxID=2795026 RepID=UPI0018DE99FE|nr:MULTISPECIES: DUF1990 domain-containing protein [Bacteria]MBH8568151.1 DUF1990 domain-containing protein [Hymenobacter negativus]MBR7207886.1 DUF1990 domain-containing protein [Microvirga sp. STS02]
MSNQVAAVPAAAKPPAWEQYRARLDSYANAKVNYDFSRQNEYTSATGWRLDDYETDLPAEAPGPPEAAGSFAAAQDVLRRYAFPPPDLITGYFDPSAPLEKRIMVLRAHFLVFNFYFGVRVSEVTDEEARPTPGGPERVWGYGYRTLEGHFEKGQIDFTIHKNLTTGAVQFRIHAVSQPGQIRNPFYWLGFKLFGRILQRKFARESQRRMKELVAKALAGQQLPQTLPAMAG